MNKEYVIQDYEKVYFGASLLGAIIINAGDWWQFVGGAFLFAGLAPLLFLGIFEGR